MNTVSHEGSAVVPDSNKVYLFVVKRGLIHQGDEIEFNRLYLVNAGSQEDANYSFNKFLLANFDDFDQAPDELFRRDLNELSYLGEVEQDGLDEYLAALKAWNELPELERTEDGKPDPLEYLPLGLDAELLSFAIQLNGKVDFDHFPLVDCMLYYGADENNWASLIQVEEIETQYRDFLIERDLVELVN